MQRANGLLSPKDIPSPHSPVLQTRRQTVPKVLFYYPDFGAQGGIERFILQTASHLKQRGRYQPVVACSAQTPFYQQLVKANIPVYGIRTLPCFSHPQLRPLDIPSRHQLQHLLAEENPALIHLHIGQQENKIFKQLGFPVVYSVHGYGSLYSLSASQNPIKRLFKKLVRTGFANTLAQMDSVLFVSQAEQTRMQQEGYLPHHLSTEVLRNGMDIPAFQHALATAKPEDLKRLLGIPATSRCVSFINRLDTNKNPLGFIDLAEYLSLVPELGPLHFLIAGDGPLAPQVQQRLQVSPLRDRILMLGHRKDVPTLLAASDLVVHIPYEEGFGFGILEALASRTLCLAHRTGGIPEILDFPEAQPMLVPPGNFRALATQAVQLLQLSEAEKNTLQEKMQQQALSFDLPQFIERLEAVYARVLS